jgi:caspase domain-containing protein
VPWSTPWHSTMAAYQARLRPAIGIDLRGRRAAGGLRFKSPESCGVAMNFPGGLLTALFVAVSAISVGADLSFADTRVALVIGNGAYQNAPRLPNPRNDATDVAAALKRSGFDTILSTDLDKPGICAGSAHRGCCNVLLSWPCAAVRRRQLSRPHRCQANRRDRPSQNDKS